MERSEREKAADIRQWMDVGKGAVRHYASRFRASNAVEFAGETLLRRIRDCIDGIPGRLDSRALLDLNLTVGGCLGEIGAMPYDKACITLMWISDGIYEVLAEEEKEFTPQGEEE
jgi:hypothetical protein